MPRPFTLITGGTRGIGKAIALRLANEGHDLLLGYARDTASAEETRAEVEELGASCFTVQADLASDAGVDTVFDAAKPHGQLTHVVNNAGATLHIGDLVDTPTDVIREVISLNLTAAVLVARRAAQVLTSGGIIVNISSGAATTGSPGEYVHYAAAKAGVDALTRGLALEVASQGLRVIGVAPGTVATDIHAAAGDSGRVDRAAAVHPLGRVGHPDDIAGVVSFALSPDAGYVNGTTIRVAGGR